MANAVIYTRVSTEEQTTNFSLEGQEKHCLECASRNNFTVIKIFKEEGASAKTVHGRPVLLELIKFCQNKKNEVSKIIVYKYDRWSRNTEEGLAVMSILAKYGVEVISATEPSQNDAMGKAMRAMMLVFAELDNNVKSERTTSGMKTAFNNGHWPWKAPLGYIHKIQGGKNALVMLEGYKPILSALFEDASTGLYTKSELAKRMNSKGFKEIYGKPATEKTVEIILKKKFYYGIMQAKKWKTEGKGNHETVTNEETWIKAYQAMFTYSLPKLSTDEDFPLRKFVLCPSCGKAVTGSFSKGNGGKYPYYFCNRKGECTHPITVRKDKLHEQFTQYLRQFHLTEVQKLLLNHVLTEKINDKVKKHKAEIRIIQDKILNINVERTSTVNANGKGFLSDLEAKNILENLRTKEAVFRIELSENKIDKNEAEAVINFTTALLSDISKLWDNLDLPRKRRLQISIFPEKVTYENGEFRTTKISQSFELIKAFSEGKDSMVTQPVWNWNQIWLELKQLYQFNNIASNLALANPFVQ